MRYLFAFLFLTLVACGGTQEGDADPKAKDLELQKQEHKRIEKDKNEELKKSILGRLSTKIENGGSLPTMIGTQEFNKPSIGKLMFDGDKLIANKQYTYFKNNNNYIMQLPDWVTERGTLDNVVFKVKNNVPEILADWKGVDGLTTGNLLIKPILSKEKVNRFYYELFTNNWRVYGYNENMSENQFKSILNDLCALCGIDPVHGETNSTSDSNIINDLNDESFFIINVSAVKSEIEAQSLAEELKKKGYSASYLWIPQYESLSKAEYFAVYIGPFDAQNECEEAVEEYRQHDPNAYGLLVSQENKRVKITGVGKVKITEPYH